MAAQVVEAIDTSGILDASLRRSVSNINSRIEEYNERFADLVNRFDGDDTVADIVASVRAARNGLEAGILAADQTARKDIEELREATNSLISAMVTYESRIRSKWDV